MTDLCGLKRGRRFALKIRRAISAWSYGLIRAGNGGGFWLGGIDGLVGAVEAAGLHGGDWFGVLHEDVPDEGAA